jgi:CubicO group peptidase (beta-lactamase class C family)
LFYLIRPSTIPGWARIDSFIDRYVRNGWVNGAVTIVVHDGHLVQYKGYGYSNTDARRPMRRDDLFRIASQTKAIVSVGLMELFEEGKFYLDEPIADFLPAFRDLFTHTAGFDYPLIGSRNMQAIYAKAGIPSGTNAISPVAPASPLLPGTMPSSCRCSSMAVPTTGYASSPPVPCSS